MSPQAKSSTTSRPRSTSRPRTSKPRAKSEASARATEKSPRQSDPAISELNGRPKTEKGVLVLQGGGALGSYQAGAYQALADHNHIPDWVAGMSIGAINAAIIVGNAPEDRVEKLQTFWNRVSSHLLAMPYLERGEGRSAFNETSASIVAMFGAPGFFMPRMPSPLLFPPGIDGTVSYYETAPLKETLLELVDFDRINSGPIRLSVGAVNVRTGNFRYFDSAKEEITPEHVMASGALPPGFPPIEIEGEYYWDGGLVSNTPLQYVLDTCPQDDMLIFQIDLFSSRGPLPKNLSEVTERDKDIRYSSRTRLNTDVFQHEQHCRRAAHRLLKKLPDEFKDDPDVKILDDWSDDTAVTIVHLIKRRNAYSTEWKDFEFSRASMEEHWNSGIVDVRRTFDHPEWAKRSKPKVGVTVLDLTRDFTPESELAARGHDDFANRQPAKESKKEEGQTI